MAELLTMPEVLANSTEAVLQAWLVDLGKDFHVGDAIATVETEKAVVDVEAERDGVLLVALVADGGPIAVGSPIAVIGNPGEQVDDLDALLSRLGVAPVGPDNSQEEGAREDGDWDGDGDGDGAPPQRRFASPLARRLAKDAGLGLDAINGSGPGGRIVRRDVEAAVEASRGEGRQVPLPQDGFVDEPHSRIRRVVARRLTESKQEIPHFYLRATCRVDRMLELRKEVNRHAAVKVSVNDFVLKAAARAHRAVPALNVIWTDEAVRRFDGVDIAVAVASDRGLVTPVVRDADRLSVTALATTVRDLRARADAGGLRQDELEGGSLTITNLGMFGTEEFAAIINPPQAAILAVGAARKEAVVADDELVVGTVMRVTLSVDHRPVDGVIAAQWLDAFVRAVEDPVQLLI